MGFYATTAELIAYAGESVADLPSDSDELERLIVGAELDVDRLLARIDRNPVTGRKLDPATLTDAQRAALSRATCAQASWLAGMESDDLLGVDPGIGAMEGISFRTTARPPSPRAVEELSGFGFAVRSGTVEPEPEQSEA